MKVTVRNFQIRDLPRVVEIERRSFGVDAYDPATFLHLYRFCGDLFLVAEADGVVVGYSVTCVEREGGAPVGHIHSIAVDPEWRRRGVGRTLIEETFKRLREVGVCDVILEVSAANKAGQAFWRCLGFTPVGVKRRFYLDGTDAIVMRKRL